MKSFLVLYLVVCITVKCFIIGLLESISFLNVMDCVNFHLEYEK